MSAPPPTPVPSPSRPAARNRAQMIADLEARLQRLEGVMEARIQNLEGEMGARVQTLEEENGRLKLHLEEQIAVLRQQERATSSDVRKVVRVLVCYPFYLLLSPPNPATYLILPHITLPYLAGCLQLGLFTDIAALFSLNLLTFTLLDIAATTGASLNSQYRV